MTLRVCFDTSVLLMVFFACIPTRAQEIGIHADATVGLDQPTRELVEHFLPDNVKSQLIDLLKQALPLLKTDVDAYIDKVNHDVEQTMTNGQCMGMGLTAEFKRQFSHPFGYSPGPVEEFRADESKMIASFHPATVPQRYVDAYSDLYYKSSVMYCQMKPTGSAADARQIEEENRQRNFTWLRINGHCDNASDCIVKLRNDTEYRMNQSDPRDVQFANARASFAKVPQDSNASWFKRVTGRFDPAQSEAVLGGLLRIQDEIRVARLSRETQASDLVKEATTQTAAGDVEVAQIQTSLQPVRIFPCSHMVTDAKAKEAQGHAAAAESSYSQASDLLARGLKLDTQNQRKPVGEIQAKMAAEQPVIYAGKIAKGTVTRDPGDCTLHVN